MTDIVFLAGYLSETIREFFGDGSTYDFRAHYSIEETPLGRGGAIRKGLGLVPEGEKYVIVTNGDIVTAEYPVVILDKFLQKQKVDPDHLATIMVVPFTSPFGLVDVNSQDNVEGFREKVELPYWVNGGVYVFSREIEARLPELGDHETSTFPALAAEGKLAALRSRAFWRSVDSFKDLQQAEDYLKGATVSG